MHQILQHNFDVIQYFFKDTSPEQLLWRKNQTNWSLGEIICHLRDVEIWHARSRRLVGGRQPRISSTSQASIDLFFDKDYASIDFEQAFNEYAQYRSQTINRLENFASAPENPDLDHTLFGRVTPAELEAKIDEYDRAYIHQMENIIHDMPLNPLMARAVYEIEQYYQLYQSYLTDMASILDIGVGNGLALRYVMLQNPHLTFAGADIRDLRLPEIKAPLQIYDGYTLPFVTNQFDVSLMFYVLHHCADSQQVLDEAIRVTRYTIIIIEEFDLPEADNASLDLTERQGHRALGMPPDMPYQLINKQDLEAMFNKRSLSELLQKRLPSRTTRPVIKYLYILNVES